MARVFLGMGANLSPDINIPAGIKRLSETVNIAAVSPCYESEAVGFTGPAFINLVIEAHTTMSVAELNRCLKQIETEFGREPDARKYSDRALDIDILVVDELSGDIDGITLPRIDVWRYAFVLRPLLDIWPNGVCPKNKTPLRDYWPHVADQPLQEVTLEGVATTSSF
jgi:2-amino-4-hydroxy-6-hydroxymethyldihydropteridine diphosphokinase